MSGDHQIQQNLSMLTQYRSLLAVSEAIATERDLQSLFKNLAEHLGAVAEFDALATALYDPANNVMRVEMSESKLHKNVPMPLEVPVETSASGWVWKTQQPLIISDTEQEERFPELIKLARQGGLRSCCFLPLLAVGRWLGALGFGSAKVSNYNEADLEFLQQVANQVAIAVDNALKFDDARAAEQEIRLLLEVNNSVVSHLDLPELLKAISACLRRVIPHDAARLTLYEAANNQLQIHALDTQLFGGGLVPRGTRVPIEGTLAGKAIAERRTILIRLSDLEKSSSAFVQRLVANGVRSGIATPLILHERVLGTLDLGSLKIDAFTESDAEIMTQIARQIAIAVDNALNYERAWKAEQEVKRKLERERLMLEINNAMVSHLDMRSLMKTISSCLNNVLHYDSVGLALYDPEANQLRAYSSQFSTYRASIEEGQLIPLEGSIVGLTFTSGRPVLLDRLEDERFHSEWSRKFREAGFKSGGSVPLIVHGRKLGTLGIATFHETHFTEDDVELLCQIANQIAIAVENALAYREIETLKNKLAEEKIYIEEEIKKAYNF